MLHSYESLCCYLLKPAQLKLYVLFSFLLFYVSLFWKACRGWFQSACRSWICEMKISLWNEKIEMKIISVLSLITRRGSLDSTLVDKLNHCAHFTLLRKHHIIVSETIFLIRIELRFAFETKTCCFLTL